MSISKIATVWCDGFDDHVEQHAPDCPQWSGEGIDAGEARRASAFKHFRGGKDYSTTCLRARENMEEGR